MTSLGNDLAWEFLQQRMRRYERVLEISQQITATLDHNALLRQIVQAASELTESEAASILLLDSASGELRFEMASNMSKAELERIVVPIENSIAGWVVTHGQPRIIHDTRLEKGFFQNVQDQTQVVTRNLLAVPLRSHRGQVIGALEALNKKDQRRYDDDDVRTLMLVALQAAIAIENARLFQQSDFMAEMVHELRTPLVALKTSAALLLRPDLPADRHDDIVRMFQAETDRLIRLTSDFLDLARLESGRAKLEISDIALDSLVDECVEIVKPQASERGIRIEAQDVPLIVRADRGKIKQVILNLLTNAVKYNVDAGRVSVNLARVKSDQIEYGQVAVADTGLGISHDNQKRLFQKFHRIPDTTGFAQGTGLGLAISRHIVEAHGGEIWLESEVGRGSVFYFTLPMVH